MEISVLRPYIPYIVTAIVMLCGLTSLYVSGRLRQFTADTVSAVYRVALGAAVEIGDEGLRWLISPEGVAFRKGLAERAYDALPATIGPVPVGLVKTFVSRDRFCTLVEQTFTEVVELAQSLDKEVVRPEA